MRFSILILPVSILPKLSWIWGWGSGLYVLYTTVEVLINNSNDSLNNINTFACGCSSIKYYGGIGDKDNCYGGGWSGVRGTEFSAPRSILLRYQNFLNMLHSMADGNCLTFTLIISDHISNSLMGIVPMESIAHCLRSKRENSQYLYNFYVNE